MFIFQKSQICRLQVIRNISKLCKRFVGLLEVARTVLCDLEDLSGEKRFVTRTINEDVTLLVKTLQIQPSVIDGTITSRKVGTRQFPFSSQ